ncbi:MAG: FGGY-family carbohydrate kinase [Lachnospiraceae bacterium]|nr:FGGY-family carbohydrate kinase [Lachnospiraceae bacterium]
MDAKNLIAEGRSYLGIEFGSTRIKGVVIDDKGTVLATGGHSWENRLENGIWTYTLDDVWTGLQDCYSDLLKDIREKYDVVPSKFASIGFSAMMHGYLAFNSAGELLVPFRTWRNTITEEAAAALTREFGFNIPQRWSIAHLYQAILGKEDHVKDIAFVTTLAGYVHFMMTGQKVLGVGDASGMFPIDSSTKDYDKTMMEKFDKLIAPCGFSWKLGDVLPKSLSAGEDAGTLTEEGAKRLDVSGNLKAGIPVCPPEGDAGTGMVATNSVGLRTGNTSAGTSVFAMVVLEKALSKVYEQIDMVTTPDGAAVAMVHCNNCTSEINAWVNIFKEFGEMMGYGIDMNELFTKLYSKALDGDSSCGGLISYNYVSGEPVTGFDKGAPLFVRTADSKFTLGNVMRMHLYSALAALKSGLDILISEEGVKVDKMYGHGGYFKTKGVGQKFLAAAIHAPVSVMETAGEGGPWGMAILASFADGRQDGENLEDFLNRKIFADAAGSTVEPDPEDEKGFDAFMKTYMDGLAIERAAVEVLL